MCSLDIYVVPVVRIHMTIAVHPYSSKHFLFVPYIFDMIEYLEKLKRSGQKMIIQSIKFCRMDVEKYLIERTTELSWTLWYNWYVKQVRAHTKSDLYLCMKGKRHLDVEGFSLGIAIDDFVDTPMNRSLILYNIVNQSANKSERYNCFIYIYKYYFYFLQFS